MQNRSPRAFEIVLILVLASCTRAAQRELAEAQEAIAQARATKADVYAAETFEEAEVKLARASREIKVENQKFVLSRSYDDARDLLASAKLAAHRAVYEARSGMEGVRADARETIRMAYGSVETAKESIAKLKDRSRSGRASEVFQRKLVALEKALSDADGCFEQGNYREARDKADAIILEARGLEQSVARTLENST